ncbi:helix-turn-helix domain-containing protein [Intestinimonas massiliensis (ex Afouda et al. 2020)]|nr:helix-turn-helix transcriptional regulator [Intestinimonas massiliensis (ex Afouda et al. 2020)]
MHEIDKDRFGAFVAQLRREKGMTQRELADRLYVSDKAVSKWEWGVSHN